MLNWRLAKEEFREKRIKWDQWTYQQVLLLASHYQFEVINWAMSFIVLEAVNHYYYLISTFTILMIEMISISIKYSETRSTQITTQSQELLLKSDLNS